jgi:hypothetical protein
MSPVSDAGPIPDATVLYTFVWPKAIYHRSLGQRPRTDVGESMILANGHIHFKCDAEDEHGLQPRNEMVDNSIAGAMPQATVKTGLRPNEDATDDSDFLMQMPRFARQAKATAYGRGRLLPSTCFSVYGSVTLAATRQRERHKQALPSLWSLSSFRSLLHLGAVSMVEV